MLSISPSIETAGKGRTRLSFALTQTEAVMLEEAVACAADALEIEMHACADNGDDEGASLRADDIRWLKYIARLLDAVVACTMDGGSRPAIMQDDSAAAEAQSQDATSGSTEQVASTAAGAPDEGCACGAFGCPSLKATARIHAAMLRAKHPSSVTALRAAALLEEVACSS